MHNKIEFVFVNIHLKSGTSDPDQTKTETKALAILAQAIKTTFSKIDRMNLIDRIFDF